MKEYLKKPKCEEGEYPYNMRIEYSPCYDINLQNIGQPVYKRSFMFYVKSLEMAKLLLSKGADVNLKDRNSATALHYAANPKVAQFFLDQGLDIEERDKNGKTPLYRAIIDDRIETAEFLFEQGANPHARTDSPSTPRSRAIGKSRWYTSRLNRLIEKFDAYEAPKETNSESSKEETPESENTKAVERESLHDKK